jgi:hypothetical protein
MTLKIYTLCIACSCFMGLQAQSVKVFLNTQIPLEGKFQGFSTVDIFEDCPPSSDTCMSWLAALKPNVIRFPSGGQAKFTHLTTGPGYGFNLDEIDAYFFDLFNCDMADCGAGSNYEAAVNDWTQKVLEQDSIPGGVRYIDEFIQMIQTLEAQLGYTIDVLFCLNIVTADAAENKEALDLLLANGIHVTGIEMGNETYGEAGGFNSFADYMAYIQDETGALGDQNYIGMVREHFPDIKIGVCAAPPASVDMEEGPGISYVVNPESKRIKYDNWNAALGNGWDSVIIMESPAADTVPLYDAAIVHFYYKSSFWSECPAQFTDDYDTYGGACCLYTFDTPDLRLSSAFDCFAAHSQYFRDSLYGYINDYYIEKFQLNNPTYNTKKIWSTEWNILETDNAPETTLFHNTLAQASVVFDWQHLAYQYNTSPAYNANFQEYRTMHNAASVSYRNMITAQGVYEADVPGDNPIRKRMFYHATHLLRHIAAEPVSTIKIATALPHINLYGYVNQTNDMVYLYYNNAGADNMDVQLNLNKIKFFNLPGCSTMVDYPVTHEYIKGQQLYSGSGVAYMYDIHPLYSADNTISSDIAGSTYKIYGSPKKVMLPRNSMGLLQLPIHVTCSGKLPAETTHGVWAYPNPADQYVDIDVSDAPDFENGYTITLYDHTGRVMHEVRSSDAIHTLDRHDLPAGIYYYAVRFADGTQTGGKFVLL